MYIYKTTNLSNNKVYIGKSEKPFNPKYLGSGKLLHKAISKYGINKVKVEIIEYCDNINQLNIREKYWISKYLENSYNLAEGGTGGWTTKHYTEPALKKYKEKLSISQKGRIVSSLTKEKLSQINKNRFHGNREILSNSLKKVWEDPTSSYNSPEYRIKLSESAKKRVWKEETKNKIRNGKIGSKNPMAIQIQVDDIIYETRRECAKAHNISETAVTKRCLNKNFNNWKIIK
jgi:group I intron endonuclease